MEKIRILIAMGILAVLIRAAYKRGHGGIKKGEENES